MIVRMGDISHDGGPERLCTAMHAAPQLFSVSKPNQRSTRLSQEALVGVKCTWKRGRLSNHGRV